MDELLVSWLGSDEVYENVLNLIEKYRVQRQQSQTPPGSPKADEKGLDELSPRGVVIPPFYPLRTATGTKIQRRRQLPRQAETWDRLPDAPTAATTQTTQPRPFPGAGDDLPDDEQQEDQQAVAATALCVKDQVNNILPELQLARNAAGDVIFSLESFVRISKEICNFPSFFNGPLYQRIIDLWNVAKNQTAKAVTMSMLEWFWKTEMEPFDPPERFFRLVKQPNNDCILRDDFLPYIKALLNDHPVSHSRCRLARPLHRLSRCHPTLHSSGSGILVQSCRVPRKVCCHRHYSHFLFGQQVPFGENHLATSKTLRLARRLCFRGRGRGYQQGHSILFIRAFLCLVLSILGT